MFGLTRIMAATGIAALMTVGGGLANDARASTIDGTGDLCSSLSAPQDFASFISCTGPGNDDFSTISGIVDSLFGIELVGDLSFSPGSESGDEFDRDRAINNTDGLTIDPMPPADDDGFQGNLFTFTSLPTNTLFVSFKQAANWELFRVPQFFLDGTETSFTLKHSLEPPGSTSHISTFAPIPLPAAGWLLLTAVGGLGIAAHRRRRKAA